MAQIGQKRPVQDTDSATSPKDDPSLTSLSKRPAPSPGFSFRPSSLQSATRGFSLRQSSLRPVTSETTSPSVDTVTSVASSIPNSNESRGEKTPSVEKGGFLKLNPDSIKMFDTSRATIMVDSDSKPVMTTAGTSAAASATISTTRNPFIQVQSINTPTLGFGAQGQRSSEQNYFSIPDNLKTPSNPDTGEGENPINQANGTTVVEERGGETSSTAGSQLFFDGHKESPGKEGSEGDTDRPIFGSQSRRLTLPKVDAFTGEEREKNIVIISARLYIFEAETHTWKERGRGEIRLNDSAKDEGVFQSRLVMRASGSYRVLLNTHLWAQMLCEKANQKSIRITAQHINTTDDIGVYLITGASKDIQQLFTAIDRRIQALQRNVNSEGSDGEASNCKSSTKTPIQEDEEDKEEDFSWQSSPDSSPEAIHVRQVKRPPTIAISDADGVQRPLRREVATLPGSGLTTGRTQEESGSSEIESVDDTDPPSSEKGGTPSDSIVSTEGERTTPPAVATPPNDPSSPT